LSRRSDFRAAAGIAQKDAVVQPAANHAPIRHARPIAESVDTGIARKLNLLDPHKIWTWDPRSRQAHRGYPKKQLPMWHRYRVELYPHVAGFMSGIRDPNGHELEFPSAFRQSRRDGKPRGIIKLKRGASP
jgi:hypothetical protein